MRSHQQAAGGLEGADGGGQAGLGDEEAGGGTGEVAFLGDGHEGLELAQLH